MYCGHVQSKKAVAVETAAVNKKLKRAKESSDSDSSDSSDNEVGFLEKILMQFFRKQDSSAHSSLL